jgi:hypothetical protein
VATLQIQILNLEPSVTCSLEAHINDEVALRAYYTLFRLSLTLPATGSATHRHHFMPRYQQLPVHERHA